MAICHIVNEGRRYYFWWKTLLYKQWSPQGGFLIVYHLENLRALSHENIPPTWLSGRAAISLPAQRARYTIRWRSENDRLPPEYPARLVCHVHLCRQKSWNNQDICDHSFHFRNLFEVWFHQRRVCETQQNPTELNNTTCLLIFPQQLTRMTLTNNRCFENTCRNLPFKLLDNNSSTCFPGISSSLHFAKVKQNV